jgi:hypothetical protein
MAKKPLPPKEKCDHEAITMWNHVDGKYTPNLNHKGKHIIYCARCKKVGHVDNGKDVWE